MPVNRERERQKIDTDDHLHTHSPTDMILDTCVMVMTYDMSYEPRVDRAGEVAEVQPYDIDIYFFRSISSPLIWVVGAIISIYGKRKPKKLSFE